MILASCCSSSLGFGEFGTSRKPSQAIASPEKCGTSDGLKMKKAARDLRNCLK